MEDRMIGDTVTQQQASVQSKAGRVIDFIKVWAIGPGFHKIFPKRRVEQMDAVFREMTVVGMNQPPAVIAQAGTVIEIPFGIEVDIQCSVFTSFTIGASDYSSVSLWCAWYSWMSLVWISGVTGAYSAIFMENLALPCDKDLRVVE